jgi:hypothetical protein
MNLVLLWVDALNKSSLISESDAETQVNIHPAGKTWQHDTCRISKILCVATVRYNNQEVGPGPTSP